MAGARGPVGLEDGTTTSGARGDDDRRLRGSRRPAGAPVIGRRALAGSQRREDRERHGAERRAAAGSHALTPQGTDASSIAPSGADGAGWNAGKTPQMPYVTRRRGSLPR
ncbi:hypothetical protein GCM10011612_15380 [Actinomyces gaoshouyii]|uniref:Uncharacterized protein n=1 Tax=Actinomyces gaoshouyii TaxID=1960083 RepID=A0A8H9H9T8_9ACTO|nr:hypothetical protein GCM10011612_15380 [Actinomyces gaoshouyii]